MSPPSFFAKNGKIVVLMSVFNSEPTVARAIRSVAHFAHAIVVVDGRYEGFDDPCGKQHLVSCDSTRREVLRTAHELGNSIELLYTEVGQLAPEYAKRNAMFDMVPPAATALLLDDDEVFYGDPRSVRMFAAYGPKVGYLRLTYADGSERPHARLFTQPGVAYREDMRIINEEGAVIANTAEEQKLNYDDCFVLSQAGLIEQKTARAKPREAAALSYRERMNPRWYHK